MCRHPLREAAPSIRNKVGKFMMVDFRRRQR
jgi:hypothetical protein